MMLRRLYNVIWYPALPLALYASGARAYVDQLQRLGRSRIESGGESPRIWMHAASVGEVEALGPVANRILAQAPETRALVTTMTHSGRDAAARRIAGAVAHRLAPLDFAPAVRAFLGRLRPQLVLITETELWPNYFFESRRAGARIVIVNGRMSERSLRRYCIARGLFRAVLECADLVLAQSDADAGRYAQLGALPERILVTGNTKLDFDALRACPPLRAELSGFADGRALLVAGSTARGEEAIVAQAFAQLRGRFPRLALVVAPRHLARVADAEAAIRSAGVEVIKATSLMAGRRANEAAALLLDTMGDLRAMYSRAAIAFVGGSIEASRGGQNVAEPAAAAVPVLFGPHHENQREVADALIAADAARIVHDAAELARACAEWLNDESARDGAGQRARAAVQALSGGAERTLKHLRALTSLR
ncbi:MAG: 3-deoxy-D-manno-octulosonic acid transferase [Candidatus Binataceae bacterium]